MSVSESEAQKNKAREFIASIKDLLNEVKTDPRHGLYWWRVNRNQAQAFAMDRRTLLEKAQQGEFELLQVYDVFSRYILKPDEQEIIRWFKNANNALVAVAQSIDKEDKIPHSPLKAVQKELAFLRQEVNFFNKYEIVFLLERINTMFDEVNQRLKVFSELKKQQLQVEKEQALTEQKAQDVKALAIKAEQAREEKERVVAIKQAKEAELKMFEEQRMADEARRALLNKEHEMKVAEEAKQRAKELSASYDDLQSNMQQDKDNLTADNDGLVAQITRLKAQLLQGNLSDDEREKVKDLMQAIARII